MNLKILLIDDHQLYIEGLKAILPGLFPNAEIHSISQINRLEQIEETLDIILLDLRMPNGGALSILDYLKKNQLIIPVLVVSASEHSSDIKIVLDNGAMGYLPKTASSDELVKAIHTVLSGIRYIPEQWQSFLSSESQSIAFYLDGEQIRLSPRQYEILQLIDRGFSTKEIGSLLNISNHTVHDYTKALYQRLNVNSRTELLHTARELHLFKFQS